jgi:pimeloyl-ACP methyl ester carboxylesterase
MPYVSGPSRIYYEDYGAGTPILLAHGVGGNHASWFNQIPTLAQAYRPITFDHRGFGNSDDVEGLGRSAFVDDIARLLDALQIERAVMVGQSMGGGSTAAFTCRFPGRVRALVHCDSLAGVQLDEPFASELAALNGATADLSQAKRVLGRTTLADAPERTLLYLQIASFNSVSLKTVKGVQPPWSPRELAAAAVPVLFIAGQEDVICPPALIRAMHEQVPGSHYAEIAQAGHSAYFEQPRAFNATLLAFLETVPDA